MNNLRDLVYLASNSKNDDELKERLSHIMDNVGGESHYLERIWGGESENWFTFSPKQRKEMILTWLNLELKYVLLG